MPEPAPTWDVGICHVCMNEQERLFAVPLMQFNFNEVLGGGIAKQRPCGCKRQYPRARTLRNINHENTSSEGGRNSSRASRLDSLKALRTE